MNSLNVSFSFRTYEEDGLLLYHKFTSPGYVKVCSLIYSCFYVLHNDPFQKSYKAKEIDKYIVMFEMYKLCSLKSDY